MGFCRILDTLDRFSTKKFLRFLFGRISLSTSSVLRDSPKQSYSRDNHGVKFNHYRLYTIDPNLHEKISFYRFFRKVSMVTPIETKQETVRRRPERGSSGDANAWFWIDPTQQRRSRTRLIQIQLAVGRVGLV